MSTFYWQKKHKFDKNFSIMIEFASKHMLKYIMCKYIMRIVGFCDIKFYLKNIKKEGGYEEGYV